MHENPTNHVDGALQEQSNRRSNRREAANPAKWRMISSNPTLEFDPGSRWLHRMNGVKSISANIAVQIARLVLEERSGPIERARNEPLKAIDDAETWVVLGSENPNDNARHPPFATSAGPLQMRIAKFDGQILSYLFQINLDQPQK
jgi:hypothetical protein